MEINNLINKWEERKMMLNEWYYLGETSYRMKKLEEDRYQIRSVGISNSVTSLLKIGSEFVSHSEAGAYLNFFKQWLPYMKNGDIYMTINKDNIEIFKPLVGKFQIYITSGSGYNNAMWRSPTNHYCFVDGLSGVFSFEEYVNLYKASVKIKGTVYTIDTKEVFNNREHLFYDSNKGLFFKNLPSEYCIWYTETSNVHYICKESKMEICECGERKKKRCECRACRLDSYHSSGGKVFYSEKASLSKMKMGFEIEKALPLQPKEIVTLRKNQWRVENDSSVEGGEYISPVLGMEEVEEYFKQFSFLFNNPTDSNCGGHIHLSVEGIQIEQLYREISPFRPVLWAIFPLRAENRFCSKNTKSTTSKYRDLYLSNYSTIEFRIFPGVDVYEDVVFRTKLLTWFYNNRIVDAKEAEQFSLAKEIIVDKIGELASLLLIRYKKNTLPGILGRIKEFYGIDTGKRIKVDEENNINISGTNAPMETVFPF